MTPVTVPFIWGHLEGPHLPPFITSSGAHLAVSQIFLYKTDPWEDVCIYLSTHDWLIITLGIPRIHVYVIFTIIYHKNQPNVGKYDLIYHTWILWVYGCGLYIFFWSLYILCRSNHNDNHSSCPMEVLRLFHVFFFCWHLIDDAPKTRWTRRRKNWSWKSPWALPRRSA